METTTPRRKRARVFTVGAGLALLALLAVPAAVLANSGLVTSHESCSGWSVTVVLNNNVSNRLVIVDSTVTGTPAEPYNKVITTTGYPGDLTIWSTNGTGQVSGTVTLTIYNGSTLSSGIENGPPKVDYTTTLVPAKGCKAHLTLKKTVVGPAAASSWPLTATGPDTLSGTSGISGDVSAGTYTLAEGSGPANYVAAAGWVCQSDAPVEVVADQLVTSVSLNAGDSETCTITNTYVPPGTLKVIKALDYQHGGTLPVGSFTLHVKLNGTDVAGSPHAGSATGTTYTVAAGTYMVSEDAPPAGYSQESISCVDTTVTAPTKPSTGGSVTIGSGESWTCTVTNTDSQPSLKVIKVVDNSNGGTLGSVDFQLHVKSGGSDVAGSPAAGSASGITYHLDAGTYIVSEDAPSSGYHFVSASGDCKSNSDGVISVTLAVGDSKTCTITNADEPALLTLKKVVVGGTAAADQWTLSATLNKVTDEIPTTTLSELKGLGPQVGPSPVFAGTYTLSESGSPANYTPSAWDCKGGSLDGNQLTLANGESATCTITNTYVSPLTGSFYFTKTVTGDLTNWTGGTFPFTVTCDGQSTTVNLTVGASGSTISSGLFGPFSGDTTCSVAEGTLPSAGTNASWSSPSYAPASSVDVQVGQVRTIAVTNTRSYAPPSHNIVTPSPNPTPTGKVAAATSKPHVTPPTTATLGSTTDGQPASGTWLILLALAGLLAGVIFLTPVPARVRRKR